MSEKTVAYLRDDNSIANKCQLSASQQAMGPNMYMYMHLTSSGGESMNNANLVARQVMAVDCINATLLFLKLNSNRFAKQAAAWSHDGYFSPCGQKMFDEIAGTNTGEYWATSIEEYEDHHI